MFLSFVLGGYLLDVFLVLSHFGLVVLVLFSIFISDPVEVIEAVVSNDATLFMFPSWECLSDDGSNGVDCVGSRGSAHPWS